jgi:hypothetical protein
MQSSSHHGGVPAKADLISLTERRAGRLQKLLKGV